jgi:hypothetical protein
LALASRNTIAAILIAAAMVSTSVLYASYASPRSVATSTVTATIVASSAVVSVQGVAIDCASAQQTGGPSTNSSFPLVTQTSLYLCERVLVIPPGETDASFVVAYQSDPDMTCQPVQPSCEVQSFTSSVLQASFSPVPSIPEQYTLVSATSVTASSSPPSINVTKAGPVDLNVTYTISVSPGTTGQFLLGYFDGCPTQIPLAVGYNMSQISVGEVNFPFYQPFLQGCLGSSMVPGGTIVSMSGFQTAWLVQTVEHQNSTG